MDTTPPQAQSKYFCTTYCVDTIFISYLERRLPRRTFHSVFLFFVFFFLFFFYTASIFLPIFTFKRQWRRSQSHSPPPCPVPCPTATVRWCPLLGCLDGRVGDKEGGNPSVRSVAFLPFSPSALVSFCKLSATCCCDLPLASLKKKKEKHNTSMNQTICSPHRLRRFKQVETQGGVFSYCVHLVTLFTLTY